MGRVERNKRKSNRKKMRRLEAFDNHTMVKLYDEAKIDDETWEGVVKKELVDVTIKKEDVTIKKEIDYSGTWWGYFGW